MKSHDDYTKALELSTRIATYNAEIQTELLKPPSRDRDVQLSTLGDTISDDALSLYNLLLVVGD